MSQKINEVLTQVRDCLHTGNLSAAVELLPKVLCSEQGPIIDYIMSVYPLLGYIEFKDGKYVLVNGYPEKITETSTRLMWRIVGGGRALGRTALKKCVFSYGSVLEGKSVTAHWRWRTNDGARLSVQELHSTHMDHIVKYMKRNQSHGDSVWLRNLFQFEKDRRLTFLDARGGKQKGGELLVPGDMISLLCSVEPGVSAVRVGFKADSEETKYLNLYVAEEQSWSPFSDTMLSLLTAFNLAPNQIAEAQKLVNKLKDSDLYKTAQENGTKHRSIDKAHTRRLQRTTYSQRIADLQRNPRYVPFENQRPDAALEQVNRQSFGEFHQIRRAGSRHYGGFQISLRNKRDVHNLDATVCPELQGLLENGQANITRGRATIVASVAFRLNIPLKFQGIGGRTL